MNNIKIRTYAQSHGVRFWELATEYGCADCTFSRKLRAELPDEEQDHLCRLVDQIAERRIRDAQNTGTRTAGN